MRRNSHHNSARKAAVLALLTALSLIMFMIESLFPPLFFPGAKMGLSNVFSLFALVVFSPLEAVAIVVIRTVLGSFFAGNVFSLAYSFTAGVVSVLLSALLLKLLKNRVSIIAISVVSAVTHNIVQLLVHSVIAQTPTIFSYMPYLALCGILAGIIVGFTVNFIVKGMPLSTFKKFL